MPRSQKKGPYVNEKLFAQVIAARDRGLSQPIKVWSRSCTIVPEFVGTTFDVHNGRHFIKVFVTEDMVGHKLGEFAPSRTFKTHTTRK
jgi:small subunit ribosomal protein S19